MEAVSGPLSLTLVLQALAPMPSVAGSVLLGSHALNIGSHMTSELGIARMSLSISFFFYFLWFLYCKCVIFLSLPLGVSKCIRADA